MIGCEAIIDGLKKLIANIRTNCGIISSHNKSVLKNQSVTSASQVDKDCNCRKKDTCSLSGKCLTTNAVYQATVTRDDTNEQETYVGHTECQFKTRYNGHTSSFRNAYIQACYRTE